MTNPILLCHFHRIGCFFHSITKISTIFKHRDTRHKTYSPQIFSFSPVNEKTMIYYQELYRHIWRHRFDKVLTYTDSPCCAHVLHDDWFIHSRSWSKLSYVGGLQKLSHLTEGFVTIQKTNAQLKFIVLV